MDLPSALEGNEIFKVHPNFTAIFTSNPEEYAGVHRARRLTRQNDYLDLDYMDKETSRNYQEKSGLIEKMPKQWSIL